MKRLLASLFFCVLLSPQTTGLKANIEKVMTRQELEETGVAGLTPDQRAALDRWLSRFTVRVLKMARSPGTQTISSNCASAIETTISGEFNGWETVFKLDNGQIWQQLGYSYMYSYSYRPGVTIYQTSGGCRMKVEDEEETILVRRIK